MSSEWNGSVIQTGADLLLEMVAEESEISVKEAANELGAEKTEVKKWADALSSEGLIEKNYSARKGTVLKYTDETHREATEKLDEARQDIREEAKEVEQSLESRKEAVQKAQQDLEELESRLKEDREQESSLEEELEHLSEMEEQLEQKIQQKKEEREKIESETVELMSRVDEALERVEEAETDVKEFKQEQEELKSKLESLEKLESHVESAGELQDAMQELEEKDRSASEKLRRLFGRIAGLTPEKASAETLLDMPVEEVKHKVNQMENPNYEVLLEVERNNENRKTLVEWLERREDG